jgi:hypothetical protein
MKKPLFFVLFVFVISIIISCKPSVVTDTKIESKYSYTSDQDAISGILEDIYEIDRNSFDSSIPFYFFDEEKEIGEWLKIKFGSEIRKGEVIKIIYTYKGENEGFDIVYRPYNKDVFPENIISGYDFITILNITTLGIYEPESSNDTKSSNNNPSRDTPSSNNNSSSSQSSSTSTNRLANTKWQCRQQDRTINLTFGQTSCTFGDSYDVISGTYRINDDSVVLDFGYGNEVKGSLIGNELTVTLMGVFRRVE